MNNLFFKSTPSYKEYLILDLIYKNEDITQRDMSKHVGVAVSMINNYLDLLEKDKLIERVYNSSKSVQYLITNKGNEKRKLLNLSYLSHAQKLYEEAKSNIETFLEEISLKGYKKILLYGAGEVAKILLTTINSKKVSSVIVLGVIDDDIDKIGKEIVSTSIIGIKDIDNYPHDGILISSAGHHKTILNKLKDINYPLNKIIEYFN